MTQPVLNLRAPIAIVKNGFAYLISPWNSFFQQLTQQPSQAQVVNVTASPFEFTPNATGTAYINGGNIVSVIVRRGTVDVNVGISRSIMLSIGDTLIVTYTAFPTITFLEL